jgi:hypothetical protein
VFTEGKFEEETKKIGSGQCKGQVAISLGINECNWKKRLRAVSTALIFIRFYRHTK